jgi:hypothetical protein
MADPARRFTVIEGQPRPGVRATIPAAKRRKETRRQRQARAAEKWWLKQRAKRLTDLRRNYGNTFQGFAPSGDPVYTDRPRPALPEGPEMIRAFQRIFEANRDPWYGEAMEKLRRDGFDTELKRNVAKARDQTFGAAEEPYFTQARFLIERGLARKGRDRRKLELQQACELVVATSGLYATESFSNKAANFTTAVDRFRRKYIAWRKTTPKEHEKTRT